jgi:hypothetical protein
VCTTLILLHDKLDLLTDLAKVRCRTLILGLEQGPSRLFYVGSSSKRGA